MAGTLYCVGVGPGDPELLTQKAARVLAACPVVAAPRTDAGNSIALDIASRAVPLAGKAVLRLDFPMTHDRARAAQGYRDAADALAQALDAGQDAALLTLGDVALYSTAGYVLALLKARGYKVEAVPGVPSFCAVAAALQTSLTDRDLPLHILPAGAQDLPALLRLPGTKVLMKAGRSLPRIRAALAQAGLLDRTMAVQDCGMPTERVWRSLADLPDSLGYFVTLVVPGAPGADV